MAIYQEKTKMTQRKLTAPELTAINTVYRQAGFIRDLIDDHISSDFFGHLANMHDHKTSDGSPLTPVDRVPTAADIGKRVKWKLLESDTGWTTGYVFCGFTLEGRPVVQYGTFLHAAEVCVIDQEAEG
jgi:hypothetical protein